MSLGTHTRAQPSTIRTLHQHSHPQRLQCFPPHQLQYTLTHWSTNHLQLHSSLSR